MLDRGDSADATAAGDGRPSESIAEAVNRRLWALREEIAAGRYLDRDVAREVARRIVFSRDL